MPFKRKRPHYKGRDNVVRGVFPEQPRHDQVTFTQARREYEVRVLVGRAELTQLRC